MVPCIGIQLAHTAIEARVGRGYKGESHKEMEMECLKRRQGWDRMTQKGRVGAG